MSIYGHNIDIKNSELKYINEAFEIVNEDSKDTLRKIGSELLNLGVKGVGKLLKAIALIIVINVAFVGLIVGSSEAQTKKEKKLLEKINNDPKLKKQIIEACKYVQQFLQENIKDKSFIKFVQPEIKQHYLHIKKKNCISLKLNIAEIDISGLFKKIAKKDWEDIAFKIAKDGFQDEDEQFRDIDGFFDYFPDDYPLLKFPKELLPVKEQINLYIKSIIDTINSIPFSKFGNFSLKCYMYPNNWNSENDEYKSSEITCFDDIHYNDPGVIFLELNFSMKK